MNKGSFGRKYVISCPNCGKAHIFEEEYVDDIVECTCGMNIYVFALGHLQIVLPAAEVGDELTARAMRRFVVSTGRGAGIPPELYVDSAGQERLFTAQEIDTEEELVQLLEEYQKDTFGNCYVTKELLDSICESLGNGKDVELKKQKNGIDVIELKKKRINTQKADGSRRLSEYTQLTADIQKTGVLFHMNI